MMKKFRMDSEIMADFRKSNVGFHGDVFFVQEQLPKNFEDMKEIKGGVVALGEATGHSHTFFGKKDSFQLRECSETKTKYLRVLEGMGQVIIRHQEHVPTVFPPGTYRIGIQREYDPFSKRIRAVVD
jgi:hypothetical protein